MPTTEMHINGLPFNETCYQIRAALKSWTSVLDDVKKGHPIFKDEQAYDGQHGEMIANLTLAYRHLEDAAMRLGKAIQAYDGGKSVYDK